MTAAQMLVFREAPSVWSIYAKVMLARKPTLLPAGHALGRIAARLEPAQIERSMLRKYHELTGSAAGDALPIAFPHVLAGPLHLALLASERFPVRLLGLVHIRNRIRLLQPLNLNSIGSLQVAIEGHVETPRGQEFTLTTEWLDERGEALWLEECVFLARRRQPRADSGTANKAEVANAVQSAELTGLRTTSFRAPAGLGRSYGLLSGDLNPIHLTDVSAKLFGFRSAIAHGMWTLARVATDLDPAVLQAPCELAVAFKLPVFMPAWLVLERWDESGATQFRLRDAAGEKTHLTGSLRRLT